MKRKGISIIMGCLLALLLTTSSALAASPGHAGVPGQPDHAGMPETPEDLQRPESPGDGLITVHNPLGQPLDSELFSLAPRFDTLDGKTIYIVDVKYPATTVFRDELTNALKEKYPKTNWISREKKGSYFEDDPELWSEIKAESAGMIIFIGH